MLFNLLALAIAQAAAQLHDPTTANQKPILATPCGLLAATFPGQVYFPGDANYTRPQANYWSVQQYELTPACRFFPQKSRQIQEALADIIIPNNVSIAVVSGGQSSVDEASNVDDGITVDLARLTEVNFFLDAGKEVWLGPGARWEDVYHILQPSNLTVAGSRSGHVGVGGHVLGGGLSWFANQRGWACDDITEMELVTPSAEIVYVKPHKFDDLFWSLKGSSGAFGIVTKIKLRTIQNGGVYGGNITYEQKYAAKLFSALQHLASSATTDPASSGYVSFSWDEAKKSFNYSAHLMNTDNNSQASTLANFTSIPHSSTNLKSTTIGESANETDASNPRGLRRSKFTLTTLANTQIMMDLHELIKSQAPRTKADISVTFEPLTIPHLTTSTQNQNIFALNPAKGPLLLIAVEYSWKDATKDTEIEKAAKALRTSMESKLKQLSVLEDFIYPGYAARDQNPFQTLNPINKKMLHATKKKYDPQNLWEKLAPGVWHI